MYFVFTHPLIEFIVGYIKTDINRELRYLADLVLHEAPLPDEVDDVQLEHVPLAAALPLLRVVHQLRNPPPEVVVAGLSTTILGTKS